MVQIHHVASSAYVEVRSIFDCNQQRPSVLGLVAAIAWSDGWTPSGTEGCLGKGAPGSFLAVLDDKHRLRQHRWGGQAQPYQSGCLLQVYRWSLRRGLQSWQEHVVSRRTSPLIMGIMIQVSSGQRPKPGTTVKSLKCWIIWRGAPLFSGC